MSRTTQLCTEKRQFIITSTQNVLENEKQLIFLKCDQECILTIGTTVKMILRFFFFFSNSVGSNIYNYLL